MACGIDIGGTKMELAVYDRVMEPLERRRVPTPGGDYAAFLAAVAGLVAAADGIAGTAQAVGLAFPGIVDGDGRSISAHVPCLNGRQAIADIERTLARPVAVDNDVRAFTHSEARGGALSGAGIGMGVVLGTGVGGALCVDGRLHAGPARVSGEFGHLPMPAHLVEQYGLPVAPCLCGAAGCAEQTLSGPGLLRSGARRGAKYASVEDLIADLRGGAAVAHATFNAYLDCLGYFISRLALTLGPEVVVFGGGLSGIVELYRALPAAVGRYLFEGVAPPVISPPVFGASGGARGAALLAREAAP